MTARLLVTIGLLSSVGCLPRRDLQPFIAVAGHYSILEAAVGPTPAPPKPDTKCQACGGKGKVGDGRIFTVCQACGGDGIAKDKCETGKCKTTPR